MIGPPSTFYNPEDISQQLRDSHAQQYQQWIEMFDNQQRGTTTAYDALQQQHHHHHHRGYHPQTQFNFVAGQYTPPHSLSAYAESASGGTVTQSNVGAPSDDYDNSQRMGEGYQPYYDLLAATAGPSSSSVSPQSYHPRAMSESTVHSYTETPSSAYQQPTHSHPRSLQTNSQQRSSAQTQSQQQTQPQRPAQPAPSHARQQHLSPHHQAYSSGSNTLSTHSASLSPASVSWTDDASYPNAHPSPSSVNGRGHYAQPQPQQRQNGALNGAAGRSTHFKRPVGTAELSPGSSPPGTTAINGVNGTSSQSHQPQKQTHSHHLLVSPPAPAPPQPPKANGAGTRTGSKRKRVKRNLGDESSSSPPQNQHRPQNPQQSSHQQQNGNGNGQLLKIVPWAEFSGEPGSDSDSDDSEDAGFFDGGGIGVGLGGLGVVSKGGKRGRGFGGRSRL